MTAEQCLYCGSTNLVKKPAPPPHYKQLRCKSCDRHIKWLPRPQDPSEPRIRHHYDLAHDRLFINFTNALPAIDRDEKEYLQAGDLGISIERRKGSKAIRRIIIHDYSLNWCDDGPVASPENEA